MATTMFFEETLKDAARSGNSVEVEVGRSSFLHGQNLVYLVIDGKTVILNETMGRKFCQAVNELGHYLNYTS
ncbi:hypothetical protein ACI2VH_23630 [Ralstonia nicotianae]|uniref:Uncharacterized protein n=2 Tax=Ralstonia solanacearum species complex TaxID=3116862 RepID=A0ABX7ZTB0_9RALS|nr:hypothetical protein [Ralstonia nicotianae]QUP58511.1 hypothetical protein GO999_08015 [Ralstonia nicotianae]